MNGFKADTVIATWGHKTHLIIGAGHLKRIAPIGCHNCKKVIVPKSEVVIRRRGSKVTYKIYCGDCAHRLALI